MGMWRFIADTYRDEFSYVLGIDDAETHAYKTWCDEYYSGGGRRNKNVPYTPPSKKDYWITAGIIAFLIFGWFFLMWLSWGLDKATGI
jgi:hypothetical protein